MPDGNFSAADLVAEALGDKPRLLIEPYDPDITVTKLRNILADAGRLYDRCGVVRLAYDPMQRGTVAQPMTPDLLMMETHRSCRPYELRRRKETFVEVNARLPRPLATMYLEWRGEHRLPVLNGITSAPSLHNDGTIHHTEGYDAETGIFARMFLTSTGLFLSDRKKPRL